MKGAIEACSQAWIALSLSLGNSSLSGRDYDVTREVVHTYDTIPPVKTGPSDDHYRRIFANDHGVIDDQGLTERVLVGVTEYRAHAVRC